MRCAVRRAPNRRSPTTPAATDTARSARRAPRKRWLEARQADLLPVEYYHVVFTLPAPISAIAYTNKEIIYGLLFDIAAETLRTIAADPKHLGARIGTTLVLHTWGSALTHHPHVHGIVPGGGLAPDADRWVPCKPGFFLSVRVLSRLFRRRFLEELAERCIVTANCSSSASTSIWPTPIAFADWLTPLRQCEWVVYAKRPFAGPEQVLAYLSRYTHRVAISNSRLVALDDRGVTFRWKDYRAHGRTRYKTMTLRTEEFMRRFLLHVLPSGFHRIRHYGLLANANRKHDIATARELLHQPPPEPPADPSDDSTGTRLRPAHLRVPALRRADDRHRDLRTRAAHPRATMLTQFTMTANRSSRTSSSALHRTVPMRTPIALLRETYSVCTHQRHHGSCCRSSPPSSPAHRA